MACREKSDPTVDLGVMSYNRCDGRQRPGDVTDNAYLAEPKHFAFWRLQNRYHVHPLVR
jgi:hypothetical protein